MLIINDILLNTNKELHYEILCILEKVFLSGKIKTKYITYLKSKIQLLRESYLSLDVYDVLQNENGNDSMAKTLLLNVLNENTLLLFRNMIYV